MVIEIFLFFDITQSSAYHVVIISKRTARFKRSDLSYRRHAGGGSQVGRSFAYELDASVELRLHGVGEAC